MADVAILQQIANRPLAIASETAFKSSYSGNQGKLLACLTFCCIFAKIRLGELHSLRIQGYASVDS
jgi:hypothetical protein